MSTNTNNFSMDITTGKSAEVVFNAIINVANWWSQEITGKSQNVDDEFFYHYRDVHSCHVRIIESIANKKVVWLVLDNFFRFTNDETEWKGTTVVFDIEQQEDRTILHFTHVGLVPEYECYNACKDGWTNFIGDSLRSLIETGQGKPNPIEGGFNEENVKKWNLQQS